MKWRAPNEFRVQEKLKKKTSRKRGARYELGQLLRCLRLLKLSLVSSSSRTTRSPSLSKHIDVASASFFRFSSPHRQRSAALFFSSLSLVALDPRTLFVYNSHILTSPAALLLLSLAGRFAFLAIAWFARPLISYTETFARLFVPIVANQLRKFPQLLIEPVIRLELRGESKRTSEGRVCALAEKARGAAEKATKQTKFSSRFFLFLFLRLETSTLAIQGKDNLRLWLGFGSALRVLCSVFLVALLITGSLLTVPSWRFSRCRGTRRLCRKPRTGLAWDCGAAFRALSATCRRFGSPCKSYSSLRVLCVESEMCMKACWWARGEIFFLSKTVRERRKCRWKAADYQCRRQHRLLKFPSPFCAQKMLLRLPKYCSADPTSSDGLPSGCQPLFPCQCRQSLRVYRRCTRWWRIGKFGRRWSRFRLIPSSAISDWGRFRRQLTSLGACSGFPQETCNASGLFEALERGRKFDLWSCLQPGVVAHRDSPWNLREKVQMMILRNGQ